MRLLILSALVAVALAADSYVVVAPSKVRPAMEYSISVNILKATGDVTLTANMVRTNDKSTVATVTATLQQGSPQTVALTIPENIQSGGYELQVSGTGGLTFTNKTQVTYSAKAMSILVQTDKAMYKPGQTVNFRVLGMHPDMTLYKGDYNIDIYDSKSNKIKQWVAVPAGEGVVTLMLGLSEQPVLGDWKIKVTVGSQTQEKAFTIAEYVLPKFEVTVELPSYYLDHGATSADLPVTVRAKYTYGKPVTAGTVTVQGMQVLTYHPANQPSIVRTGHLDATGTAVINFPISELHHLTTYLDNHKISFNASVTDTLTGIGQNGTSEVTVYTHAVKLEFLSSNPSTFKPGLEYIAYLKVSQPDGLPVASAVGQSVALTTSVTAEIKETGTTPLYYFPRTTNFQLSPEQLTLPDNGLVEIRLTVPDNATNLNIQAHFQSVSASSSVSKSYSPSNNYIQLFLRSSNQLTAGSHVNFEAVATEPIQDLIYQVMSRGSMVLAGSLHSGATHKSFSIPLHADMAPNARIVVYYVRADGEIVTDSISFDVDGAFQNQVSVSMSKSEAQPADSVDVRVQASPQSTAYLLAVDQSVLLLKSGNDITADQVIGELRSYDTTTTSHPSEFFPMFGGAGGMAVGRRKRMIWWPYPTYYGGSDANQIFTNAGVLVMTDAMVYHYVQPYQLWVQKGQVVSDLISDKNPLASSGQQGLQEVDKIRSDFPETWLWDNITIG